LVRDAVYVFRKVGLDSETVRATAFIGEAQIASVGRWMLFHRGQRQPRLSTRILTEIHARRTILGVLLRPMLNVWCVCHEAGPLRDNLGTEMPSHPLGALLQEALSPIVRHCYHQGETTSSLRTRRSFHPSEPRIRNAANLPKTCGSNLICLRNRCRYSSVGSYRRLLQNFPKNFPK
jgi:hypothetical protein